MRLALALAFAGCAGSPPTGDTIVWESFPYDGQRTWEYVSTDEAIPYRLVVEIFGPGEPGLLDTTVYTLHYKQDCFGNDPSCVTGEILRIVKWSSDPRRGVLVHGFGDLLAMTDFDPPITISADDASRGDFWETTTGGATWTSTFTGISPCAISMDQEWPSCFTFEVETDAGEGYPLAGTWQSAQSHGVASLEVATETGRWQLNDFWCDEPGCGTPWY